MAVKLNVEPAQILELLAAVGAAGIGFTVTLVDPAALVHPNNVRVTKYVPLAKVVAPTIVGFCNTDVNASGQITPRTSQCSGRFSLAATRVADSIFTSLPNALEVRASHCIAGPAANTDAAVTESRRRVEFDI